MPQNAALALITLAVLAVLALQMLAARKGPLWLGAVIPTLYAGAVVLLLVTNDLDAVRPLVVAAAGLVLLLGIWTSGRQSRARNESGKLLSHAGLNT